VCVRHWRIWFKALIHDPIWDGRWHHFTAPFSGSIDPSSVQLRQSLHHFQQILIRELLDDVVAYRR
jgi:hypothetical protein